MKLKNSIRTGYIVMAAVCTVGISGCKGKEEPDVVEIVPSEEVDIIEPVMSGSTEEEGEEDKDGSNRVTDPFVGVALPVDDFLASEASEVDLYRDYIKTDEFLEDFSRTDKIHYALAYLDSDDRPELFAITGDDHIADYKIISTDDNGEPFEMYMCFSNFGNISYGRQKGILAVTYGGQGYFTTYYVKLEKHDIEYLGSEVYNAGNFVDPDRFPEYQIRLPLPDDMIKQIESDKTFFWNGFWDNDWIIPDGEFVEEEEYGKYNLSICEAYERVTYSSSVWY